MVCRSDGRPQLQLPQQSLDKLCDLKLSDLEASAAPAGSDGGPRPLLCHLSTALACLELNKVKVALQGLPSLTGLQRLGVTVSSKRTEDTASNVSVLAEAIPQLVQLTSLHLGGAVCVDAVLAHITSCRNLLQLRLDKCLCTASSFTSLPQSLTLLDIGYGFEMTMTAEEEASVPKVTFSPDSTPALCQLPALQSLQVQRAQRCHVALLSGLTALTCLVVEGSSLAAGENELNLLVLNRLTKLQDLVLSSMSRASPAAADPRDFAAITASRQLTKLKLSHSLLEPDDLHAVFPAGRHCDKLQHLSLWIDWLEDAEAMSSMVRCCENLQELKIICHGGHEVAAEAAEVWREGLAPLTGLSRLTYLYMSALDVNIAPEVWGAITALSTLRKLEMETLEVKHINGMMQRTALRQLTELQLNIMPMGGDIVDIVVRSKAPAGAAPNVWLQLPQAVLRAAGEICSEGTGAECLRSLLAAAQAALMYALDGQQQLQQRVVGLEQLVADLQAGMAAVLTHLHLPPLARQ